MSGATTQNDWTKPAAMAIPKGGFFKDNVSRADTARSFPRRRLLRLLDHREDHSRAEKRCSTNMQGTSRRRWPDQPDCLAVLKLHYLRWVLFPIKGETYFMYQGIFDTDFDKYTEDAVALFSTLGIKHGLRKSRRLSRGLEDQRAGLHQVRSRAPLPEFPGIRRVSVCERRRDQEGAQAEGGVFQHARPDAMRPAETCTADCHARIRRHPTHSADPRARAHRTIRVSVVSQTPRADARGWPRSWKRCIRPQRCALRSTRTSAG